MPTTVFSAALNSNNGGNGGLSFRDFVTVTSGGLGQVRVTFQAGSSGLGLQADHASIALQGNGTPPNVQLTPTELLFSGVSGFNLPGANQTIVSDWLTFAFAITDTLAITFDINGASNGACEIITGAPTGVVEAYFSNTPSYNQANFTAGGSLAGTDFSVALIETQAAPSLSIGIWPYKT